jgi:predicted HicB family RNase H-like nuclease
MEKERKAITLRVSPQLKFQIEKAVVEEGDSTINSWLIKVIKEYLEAKK